MFQLRHPSDLQKEKKPVVECLTIDVGKYLSTEAQESIGAKSSFGQHWETHNIFAHIWDLKVPRIPGAHAHYRDASRRGKMTQRTEGGSSILDPILGKGPLPHVMTLDKGRSDGNVMSIVLVDGLKHPPKVLVLVTGCIT
jgi:hypothetical protein